MRRVGGGEGRGARSRRAGRWFLLALALGVTLLWGVPGLPHAGAAAAPSQGAIRPAAGFSIPASGTGSGPSKSPQVTLTVGDVPTAICVNQTVGCGAQAGESQVTLTASPPNATVSEWPPVQVAFVVETTPYDGVFDPTGAGNQPDPGFDECAEAHRGVSTLCEESNGVPVFVANAQSIANAIVAANPHTNVSFAMVDYFANLDQTDDGDGQEYHVDIPRFVPANGFGGLVASTFQADQLRGGALVDGKPSGYVYSDSDMSDNILDSSMITALYGTIIGSGLNWSASTHHVIVWMGSTAPRDPNFPVDYSVSPSDHQEATASTCEPSFRFVGSTSPDCEGWINPQDGTRTDSIAALAHRASTCTDSIGKVCTIDTIDLYTTPTDPYSSGWPCTGFQQGEGGCPGGTAVVDTTRSILDAGCDMAAATGGTWSGPAGFVCPNQTKGSMGLYTIGSSSTSPDLTNPDLLKALAAIGFGPQLNPLVANGTRLPMFQFVPYGSIALVPGQMFEAHCTRTLPHMKWPCDPVPTVRHVGGQPIYGWNWSDSAALNSLLYGDFWSVSFLVYARAGPFGYVPVDACTTRLCNAQGEILVDGEYSWLTYNSSGNHTIVTSTFPLALIDVIANNPPGPGPSPNPSPPVNPPSVNIPVGGTLPAPVAVPTALGAAVVPVQVALVGLVAAGFLRVTMRNRTVALRMAMQARRHKPRPSRFEPEGPAPDQRLGRFE
jgi:hypothetical protein